MSLTKDAGIPEEVNAWWKLLRSCLRTWNTAPSSSLKSVSIKAVLSGETMVYTSSRVMFNPHRPANIISTRVVKSPPSDRS